MDKESVLKKLNYKVSNMKDQVLPYFESCLSNKMKANLRLNADRMIKGTNKLVIYTIWNYKTIVVSSFPCLVTLRLGLAVIKDGNKISSDVAFFVNAAAKDGVIGAKTVIGEVMRKEKNPIFMFQDRYITYQAWPTT